jgi:hypothetical protein
MRGVFYKRKDRTLIGQLLDYLDRFEEIAQDFEDIEDKEYANWIETCLYILQFNIQDELEKLSKKDYREDK